MVPVPHPQLPQELKHRYYWVFIKNCVFSLKFVIFLNSASSAAALVFYLPGVCTHTDAEGKQRKARVWNILKSLKKNTILNEHPVPDDPRGVLDGVEQLEFKGHLPGAGSRLLGLVRNYFFLGMKHFHNPKTDLFSLSHFGGRH